MTVTQNLDPLIRGRLRELLRTSKKSRVQIAEELSRILPADQHVSEHILSNWANGSKRAYSLPARVVPALCEVLQDDSLQQILLNDKQIGEMGLGRCVAKWLDKRFAKSERPTGGTAGRS